MSLLNDFSMEHLLRPEWILVWFCVVVLAVYFIRLALRSEPREILAFETTNGRVTVARQAIVELIQKAASLTDGVAKCSSRIVFKRSRLTIRLRIHLHASHNLRQVSELLKRRIAESLRVTLGMTQLGPIDAVVVGLIGTPEMTVSEEGEVEGEMPVFDDEEEGDGGRI